MTSLNLISDREWEQVADFFPSMQRRGNPICNRRIFEAIVWVSNNQRSWQSLPPEFPSYLAVYARFRKWRTEGIIQPALKKLNIPMPALQSPGGGKKEKPVAAPVALQNWLFGRN